MSKIYSSVKGLDVGEFTKAVKRWILNNEPRTKYEFDMKMVEGMVEYKKEQLIDKEVMINCVCVCFLILFVVDQKIGTTKDVI